MTDYISAKNLSKSFGKFKALSDVSISIQKGQIVGLIGANGAGKTTLINAILGLSSIEGDLSVLGLDPYKERDELMKEVCFISDVATLPKWIKVEQAMQFVEGVHPKFDREKALKFLGQTSIPLDKKVGKLSKGMIVQLHLALIIATEQIFFEGSLLLKAIATLFENMGENYGFGSYFSTTSFLEPSLWVGLVASVLMIVGCIEVRKRNSFA